MAGHITTVIAWFTGLLIAIAIELFWAAYNAAVIFILWLWFAVPLGFPPISYPLAVGLVALTQAILPTPPEPKAEGWEEVSRELAKPLCALAIGCVAKLLLVL